MRSWRTVTLVTISVLLGMTSVIAQGLVTQSFPQPYPTVSIQFQRPDFRTSRGINPFSGAFALGGSYPLSENLVVSAHVPWGFYTSEYKDKFILGNVGLAINSGWRSGEKTTFAGSMLVSLKTSPSEDSACNCSDKEFAAFVGWYSDPYQAQRFLLSHWMIGSNLQVKHVLSPAITLGGELGPQWFIPTGEWGHSSLYVQGGAYVNAGSRVLRGIGEYVAMYWAAGDNPQDPHLYDDMLGIGFEVRTAGPRLTAYYQVMLESHLREVANGSYGLRVVMPIGANGLSDEQD